MGGMAGMGGIGVAGAYAFGKTNSLAVLIQTTIDPPSWNSGGGSGTGSVVQFHELLVVKNSQTVHGKIKALLEMMRTSANSPHGAAAPGGPAPSSALVSRRPTDRSLLCHKLLPACGFRLRIAGNPGADTPDFGGSTHARKSAPPVKFA